MAARKGSLIATAKAAKDQVAASKAAQEAQEAPAAVAASKAPQAVQDASQEPAGTDWVTTAIHVPRDVLILLRRVAVERANLNGGRPSVSAVLVDLVRANSVDLERETGR